MCRCDYNDDIGYDDCNIGNDGHGYNGVNDDHGANGGTVAAPPQTECVRGEVVERAAGASCGATQLTCFGERTGVATRR